MPPREHHDDERHDGLPDDERLLDAIRSAVPEPAASDPGDPEVDAGEAVDADLARLGGLVRSLSDEDVARDEPPSSVWAGISARVGDAPAADPSPTTGPFEATPGVPPVAQRFDDPPVAPLAEPPPPAERFDDPSDAAARRSVRRCGPDRGTGTAPRCRRSVGRAWSGRPAGPTGRARRHRRHLGRRIPLHARRRRRPPGWLLGAAAAAVALVLVAVGVVASRDGDDERGRSWRRRALEPLPDEPTGGASPVRGPGRRGR